MIFVVVFTIAAIASALWIEPVWPTTVLVLAALVSLIFQWYRYKRPGND